MYELAILGGGPAGVAAGVYAARKKISTVFLTKDFGGQSVNSDSIENWIGNVSLSGSDLATMLEKHLRAQEGLDIVDGVSVSDIKDKGDFFVVEASGKTFEARRLLVALGSRYRRLDVPGETDFEGKGVFYCSICDAPLMKDKVVAVVGGGNSAFEAVIDLLPYAQKIYLLVRSDVFKGDPVYQDRVKNEKSVEIITNANVTRVSGDRFVSGVSYKQAGDDKEKNLNVSGVFVEIGSVPNSGSLKGMVEFNERGNIVVDHQTFQTSHPRVWAAGDITDSRYNQLNPAVGDGVKAVLNVYDQINRVENPDTKQG